MRQQADPKSSGAQSFAAPSTPTGRRERARARDKESETAAAVSPHSPTEEQLRTRAFEIYASGQHPTSDAIEIWLQAERELQNR